MLKTDVVVIGAGPCGLFQVFELGLQGLKTHLIEALPYAGGQCIELYPDKPIYDIPACPEITARELVQRLMTQIAPFKPVFHFGQRVSQLQPAGERWQVKSDNGLEIEAGAVVIATGAGAIRPIRLKLEGIDQFEGRQLFYSVGDVSQHQGKRLVILGGGDAALDWALKLQPEAESVVLIHRSERFRAQAHSVAMMQRLCEQHQMQFLTGRVVAFDQSGERLCALKVLGTDGVTRTVELDQLLVFFGLAPDSGTLRQWGIETVQNQAMVDTARFETSLPGIYAVGDANGYVGKRKLILSGFHEAALAAFAIRERLTPQEPVYLQYTTTSPVIHQRLGVSPDISDLW